MDYIRNLLSTTEFWRRANRVTFWLSVLAWWLLIYVTICGIRGMPVYNQKYVISVLIPAIVLLEVATIYMNNKYMQCLQDEFEKFKTWYSLKY